MIPGIEPSTGHKCSLNTKVSTHYRFKREDKKKDEKEHACNENKAAIQGNESSKAVKEPFQVNLIIQTGMGFAYILKLNYPTWEIDAQPLIPEPQFKMAKTQTGQLKDEC